MGLEAPLALLGLLFAGLPFLLHRIRRRDLVPIALPTFRLLLDAEAQKRRSRGLTDLLLLALRVGILVAACLGVAAPYVTARLSYGDGSVASVAIVVDDSMSMLRQDGHSTLLEQAISRARDAVRSLPEGSEVVIVAGGDRPRLLLRRTDELGGAEAELDRLAEPTLRATRLRDAAALAVQQLGAARNSNRRLLVISDFANHTRLSKDELAFEGVSVTLDRVGSAAAPTNLYFTSARAIPDPAARGQISIAFELAADGDVPDPVTISVVSAGEELAREEITVAGRKGRGTLHVRAPDRDQDPTALLRIESSDGLAEDNRIGLLLRRSDAVEVMLVNGDPHPASAKDELFYAISALRLSPPTVGALSVRSVDASALAKYDLSTVDLIVLANVKAPRPRLARRLLEFVDQGGGLVVAAGANVLPRAYNAALGEGLPCRIRARSDSAGRFAPPTAGNLFDDGPAGLSQAELRRRLLLECTEGVELAFEDGSPAVAVANVGRGRTALLAVPLDADWGDLPLRPGYLPLLVSLIRHVSQAAPTHDGPIKPGTVVSVGVPPGASEMEVVTPDGLRNRFDALAGRETIEFGDTHVAGPYRVLAASASGTLADAPRGAFVVAVPEGESDLRPLPNLDSLNVASAERGHGALVKNPLAPLLLLLFGLLVIAEGAVRLRTH